MSVPFKGVINLDVRDSVQDWEPYLAPRAPAGAPNVLYIVWDDTGIAAWDTFGGLIETPNMTRIGDRGLRYTNWHTTALCSPTRSSLLTGRNAHANGMACIVEGASGFPGASAVIPPENGTLAEILVEHGYSTMCVGKWHLTPETESNMASSRRTWPTGRGFERYYGFLGGETNQWYPDLTYDQHHVEPPASPEEGYHLSQDLADRAIEFIRDVKQVAPEKPWFCYFAPGANHAPHHAPKEWIDKYRGAFDMGYERYREVALERMKELRIVPRNTELSPINPWPAPDVILEGDLVKPWDSLSADEQRLFARMAEVYAGFCSYTDHEIGRLLDYLEESGQLENTIVVVVSDNGASGEGSPDGSVNENKFFNGWPEDPEENMGKLDELGSPSTYNHYPTGWAWAFNAPYKMFKRYTLEGGIADPLVISWPGRIADAGGVRDQYHHAIDVVPTILELVGVEPPAVIKGYAQTPIQGVSMAYSFDDPGAESRRQTQYYAMLGTRAIYHQGWKAVARHGAISGKGRFMEDEWELYNVAEDRAEVHDLAAKHPEKVQELIATWFAYAGRNNAFPLDDRTAIEQLMSPRPSVSEPRDEYVYYPGTSPVPEGVAANVRNRSFSVLAELDVQSPDAEGVLFAMGSRFGGQVLYLKGGRLHYAYNFLGIEQHRVAAERTLPTGKVVVGAEFEKEKEEPRGVANGTLKLYVGDDSVAEGPMRTQPGKFGLGEGVSIGRSGPEALVDDYRPPFEVKGAVLERVLVNVSGEHYVDLETEALAMLARE
jgi:arylsulfatase A-like enzyme